MEGPDAVLQFWFIEAGPNRWFKKSGAFDRVCEERFGDTLEAARVGECWHWRRTPEGRCAEIIVLDQFSRNLFRDSARAFAQDPMALALAQEAVARGDDLRMSEDQRYFTYMPYMHSESLRVHEEALRLFDSLADKQPLRYEKAHREVLETFGRYPARNKVLGRKSSPAELEYLEKNGGF